jgi:murein DD-endopeptidase MepM/ murein hydrolase activator NlpD
MAAFARPSPEKLWSGVFVFPTTGVITSVFGARRAYGNRPPGPGHSGTDIANMEGTPVTAPAPGVVVFADWLDSFGNAVALDHGQGVFTYYLHMKQKTVQVGDRVQTGSQLGFMGKEGIATGPHLHWSMVVGGEKVSALEWTENPFE